MSCLSSICASSRPVKYKRVKLESCNFEMFEQTPPCQGAALVCSFLCQNLHSVKALCSLTGIHKGEKVWCPKHHPTVTVCWLPVWEVVQGAVRRRVKILWVILLVQTMSALLWPERLWWQCLWPSLLFPWPKSSWASLWHYILMHVRTCRGLGDPLRLPSLPHQTCPDVAVYTVHVCGPIHTMFVISFFFF